MPEKSRVAPMVLPSRDRVAEEVIQIVTDFFPQTVEAVQEWHDLFDDLGADSLDIIELTMEIGEHFEITVPDENTENTRTVGEIIEGVCRILENTPVGNR